MTLLQRTQRHKSQVTSGAMHRPPAPMQLPRLPPLTHAARAHPVYRHGPSTHALAGTEGQGNTVFCICQPCARDSGNKIAASAHVMGSGGLAVDVMAIGCLGVDPRGENGYSAIFLTLDFRSSEFCAAMILLPSFYCHEPRPLASSRRQHTESAQARLVLGLRLCRRRPELVGRRIRAAAGAGGVAHALQHGGRRPDAVAGVARGTRC